MTSRVRIIIVALLLAPVLAAHAGNPVSGVWTLDDSPVLITENSYVPEGAILRVEAGVQVLFLEGLRLEVYGMIECFGTEKLPVVFQGYEESASWEGITIYGFPDSPSSRFVYTDIINAHAGIRADQGTLYLEKCHIKADIVALMLENSSYAELYTSELTVTSNVADAKTVYAFTSYFEAHNCIFDLSIPQTTVTPAGGALHFYLAQGLVDSCHVRASSRTGANGIRLLACYGGVTIRRTSVHVIRTGGLFDLTCAAIYASHTDLLLDRMSLHLETDGGEVYGLYVTLGSDVDIVNSIIAATNIVPGTTRYAAFVDPNTSNSSIGMAYTCVNQVELDNGTPFFTYDPNSVIRADPDWVDPVHEDYHLMPDSPCIDAGSPFGEQDPDGTLPDLGCHMFFGTVADEPPLTLAREFRLNPVWPNPFNAMTRFSVELPRAARVRISVQNVLGLQVAQLADGELSSGTHDFVWQAGEDGNLASGIYLLRVVAGGSMSTQRLVLLK